MDARKDRKGCGKWTGEDAGTEEPGRQKGASGGGDGLLECIRIGNQHLADHREDR
jgi:hypothetical protein